MNYTSRDSARTRKVTTELLQRLDDGTLDAKKLAQDLLGYMSESDVADFAESEGYTESEDEDGESDDDDEDNELDDDLDEDE